MLLLNLFNVRGRLYSLHVLILQLEQWVESIDLLVFLEVIQPLGYIEDPIFSSFVYFICAVTN